MVWSVELTLIIKIHWSLLRILRHVTWIKWHPKHERRILGTVEREVWVCRVWVLLRHVGCLKMVWACPGQITCRQAVGVQVKVVLRDLTIRCSGLAPLVLFRRRVVECRALVAALTVHVDRRAVVGSCLVSAGCYQDGSV